MPSTPPDWTRHTPGTPPTLPPTVGGGRLVAIVASPGAVRSGWAPAAAVDVARSWHAEGARVVLADAGLERPSLHDVLGVPNAEGISDAVVFGASPGRVAKPVGAEGLLFTSSGTAVGDVGAVFQAPRWRLLVSAFRDAGAMLVLYIPSPPAAGPEILHDVDDVVVLGAPGDDEPSWLPPSAPVRHRFRSLEESKGPSPVRQTPPSAGRWRSASRTLGVAMLLATAAMVVHRLQPDPDDAAQAQSAPLPPPTEESGGVLPGPELISPLRAFSVDLGSFRDQAGADRRRRELETRVPRGLLFTAPVLLGGTEYTRLLLGPAPDSAGAADLSRELAEALNLASGSWAVRATPLAFLLGEVGTLAEAGAQVVRWQEEGIPVYVLSVTYEDGTAGFRVYAGAYEDPKEAEYLGSVLAEAGAGSAPLTLRVGTLPAG